MNVSLNPYGPLGIQRSSSFKTNWPPQPQSQLDTHDEVMAFSAMDQAKRFFGQFANLDNKELYLNGHPTRDFCSTPGKVVAHHVYESGRTGSAIVHLSPEGKLNHGIYLTDDDRSSLRCTFDAQGEPLTIERRYASPEGPEEHLILKLNPKNGTLAFFSSLENPSAS